MYIHQNHRDKEGSKNAEDVFNSRKTRTEMNCESFFVNFT